MPVAATYFSLNSVPQLGKGQSQPAPPPPALLPLHPLREHVKLYGEGPLILVTRLPYITTDLNVCTRTTLNTTPSESIGESTFEPQIRSPIFVA